MTRTRTNFAADREYALSDRSPDEQWYGDWHLASSPHEARLTEFEFALLRCNEAFEHFSVQLTKTISEFELGASDVVILHIIRMHDRAKPLQTIARLVNRDDMQNIQYSLRKLVSVGLVAKEKIGKSQHYTATDAGRDLTDRFARLKGLLLSDSTQAVAGSEAKLGAATQFLTLMTGLYEEGARTSATYTAFEGSGARRKP